VVVQLDQTNQRQEKMMASDDEKIKTNSAAEHEAPPEKKSTSGAEASKADGGESAAASPPGYSRGEGQKPVSKAYRENWNVIFAKKKKRYFARSAERNSFRCVVCTENSILAPRIHGELLKLGFEVAQSRVAKYMVKRCGPPSQGWHMAIYECFPPSEGAPALPKNQTPPLTRFFAGHSYDCEGSELSVP